MQWKYTKDEFKQYLNDNLYNYDYLDNKQIFSNEKVCETIYNNKIELDSIYRTTTATALLQILELRAKKSLNNDLMFKTDIRNTTNSQHYEWLIPFMEVCFNDLRKENYNESDALNKIYHSTLKNESLRQEFIKTFYDAKKIIIEVYHNASNEEKVVLEKMKTIYNTFIMNSLPEIVKGGIEYEKQYFNTNKNETQKELSHLSIKYDTPSNKK